MIRSIKFKPSHYAAQLVCIGMRKLAFPEEPSLTVLFGPNGCGKSTMIRGLGEGSATTGGWSRPPEPTDYPFRKSGDYEKDYDVHRYLSRSAEVDWDGTPTMLLDAAASDQKPLYLEESTDGLAQNPMDDNLHKLFSSPSSGQWRMARMNELELAFGKPSYPDLRKPLWQDHNDIWQRAGKALAGYVRKLKPTKIPTLLLDEPDRSLSITNAIALYTGYLPRLARNVQIVVATHSPFVLDIECNLVDMKPGYAEECRKAMDRLARLTGKDRKDGSR
jgi:hypothetical protein